MATRTTRSFAAGVGLTDLVKRPTPRDDGVRPEERRHGRPFLEAQIRAARPEMVIFTFKAAAIAVFGKFEGNGWMPGLTLGGAPAFVMPGADGGPGQGAGVPGDARRTPELGVGLVAVVDPGAIWDRP